MAVKAIPDGYHTITPYLMVRDAIGFLEFLRRGFGAEVSRCHKGPDGAVMNAEVRLGTSMMMVAEARQPHAPTPAHFYLYVENTDTVYRQALEAGAKSVMEPADQFYGDRNGGVTDGFGNTWWIGTRKEDLTDEEIERRAAAMGRR